MKRLLVCLFIVFSLMLGPVAHAAGADCLEPGHKVADQFSKEKKQDNGKLASNANHHCCCNPTVDRVGLEFSNSSKIKSSKAIPAAQTTLASFIVGPLLEPPSLA